MITKQIKHVNIKLGNKLYQIETSIIEEWVPKYFEMTDYERSNVSFIRKDKFDKIKNTHLFMKDNNFNVVVFPINTSWKYDIGFTKKKIFCENIAPIGEKYNINGWLRDLTRECVESNPGPSLSVIRENEPYYGNGIYYYCHNCESHEFICDYKQNKIIFRYMCDACFYTEQALVYGFDMNEINDKIYQFCLHGDQHGKSFLSSYINVPYMYDKELCFIEDACLLLYHLTNAKSYTGYTIAIVNFCKLRGNRIHMIASLLDIADYLFKEPIMDCSFEQDIMNRVYSSQSNIFSDIRDKISVYDKLKESPLYKKIHKFFVYILCTGLLDNVNITFQSLQFDKFEEEAYRRSHKPGVDMVMTITDTILFLCEHGYEYFKTGDISVFLHSGSSYEKWIKMASKLKLQSKYLNNPEPHGFDRFTFLAELKDTIESGKAIVKFTGGLDKSEKLYLQRILSELQMIEAEETTKRSAQRPRKDPFGILIHGSSHIAKSKLTEIMFKHYGKCFNLPIDDTYRYTRCPTDEYWSGFDSTQWCIVMDDIAFLAPTGEVDPTLKELLQVKNSVPYTPPQAALEDKGRTPVKAELLIATTNTKHLNLHAYFACPFAIARRLSYVVTPTVKPEYSKNGFMVDSRLIPPTPEGEYMDIWNFTVSVPVPESEEAVDNQRTRYQVIEEFSDINSFLQWYIYVAEEHSISQSKADKAAKSMHIVDVCKGCKRAVKFCLCNTDWPHKYQNRCSLCHQITTSCVCDFEDQSSIEINDLSMSYKIKLWWLTTIIKGDKMHLPKLMTDVISKYLPTLMIMYFVLFFHFPLLILTLTILLWLLEKLYRNFFIIVRYYYEYRFGYQWKYKLMFHYCKNEFDTYRILFRLAGEKAENFIKSNNALYALGLIIAIPSTIVILRKLWNMAFPEYNNQGSAGVTPQPQIVEKKTFYYHDPYAITPCEISGASTCVQGNNLYNLLKRQTARFEIRSPIEGKGVSTTAVNIHGSIWLLNKHSVKYNEGVIDIVLDDTNQSVSRNMYNISYSLSDFKFVPNTDIAIIEIRCMSPGKSLMKYFPLDKPLKGVYKGKYVLATKTGIKSELQVNNIRLGTCPVFNIPAYNGFATVPTSVGDCGSLCLVEVGGGQVLLGSHISGSPTGGVYFQHISQELLSIVYSYDPQVSEGDIPISAPGYDRKLIDLHHKSSIRFLEEGTAKVYGSFDGYRAKHKSKVEPTLMKEYVEKHGYVGNFGKPDMTWKPWHIAIKDMTTPVHCYLTENIKKCEDAYFNDIISQLGDKIKMLEVYNLDTALNGADGVTYVDKLNAATSAGNPFKKSKKHFITEENGKIIEVDNVILDRIKQIEACYDNGTRFHPQFCGHLKDEPVSFKKIQSGKTRVFTGGEFAWSIVVRRYLLSHIRLIQNNQFIFEAMPGVVAQSIEWQKLYEHITTFGEDTIVAGDYGKFDKRMAAPFILAAFRILERLAKEAGWPESDLQYIRCIAYDTAFPCIDFNGDLIEIQGNPSGHPLTVIINCIVNSLYMRYAYLLISGKDLSTFQANVKLATYGDDNIMGVSKDCPKFNHTRIAAAMKCIGVEYTMADKEAESIPYIHISNASFLKRSFVYDKDIGAIVAPLDESSFNKMLTYRLPKADMASEAHAICVIETAQREYFYYGKKIFEEKQAFFRQMVIDLNLECWVRDSTFPSYYDMVYDFWMKYDDVENALKYAPRE